MPAKRFFVDMASGMLGKPSLDRSCKILRILGTPLMNVPSVLSNPILELIKAGPPSEIL